MNDRELLELAAKACGDPDIRPSGNGFCRVIGHNHDMGCDVMSEWNPRTDDGDSRRLEVAVGITVHRSMTAVMAGIEGDFGCEENFDAHNGDCCAATRIAVLRAAAEIGRAMP